MNNTIKKILQTRKKYRNKNSKYNHSMNNKYPKSNINNININTNPLQSSKNITKTNNNFLIDRPNFDSRFNEETSDLLTFLNIENPKYTPIKISTLNIAGLLKEKMNNIMEYIWAQSIDICILTETHYKHTFNTSKDFNKIEYQTTLGAKIYYIHHNERSHNAPFEGISIIITEHIHNHYLGHVKIVHNGRLTSISLQTSLFNTLHIYGIYVNANNSDKESLLNLTNNLINAIDKTNQKHSVVIAGDFNIDPQKHSSSKIKRECLAKLFNRGFIDNQK